MRHHFLTRFGRRHGRPLTAAIAALAASAWIAPAFAQQPPPPPPPGQEQPGGPGRGPWGGPGMGPGMGPMGGPGGWHHHRGGPGGMGGLFYHREDKQLTAAEVQRIAEAFLLWQGERSWRVTDVHEAANNTVEFSITTAQGGVVAKFSMDRKTGRPRRIG